MNQSQNAIFTSPMGEENLMNNNHRDSESITDVCSNEDLPEVELVNLLEEQLPQYRLKVDSLFLYENQDWTRSPHRQHHASGALSPVLAEETFRYMSGSSADREFDQGAGPAGQSPMSPPPGQPAGTPPTREFVHQASSI